MDVSNQDEILSIIEYVKSAKLKGNIKIEENAFIWELGDVCLHFYIDYCETTIEYFGRKNKICSVGHFHEDNSSVVELINDINCESNMVEISVSFLGSSFNLLDKTTKKKKSWFFVRRYYSK